MRVLRGTTYEWHVVRKGYPPKPAPVLREVPDTWQLGLTEPMKEKIPSKPSAILVSRAGHIVHNLYPLGAYPHCFHGLFSANLFPGKTRLQNDLLSIKWDSKLYPFGPLFSATASPVLQSVTCGDRLRWRDAHLRNSRLPVVTDWDDEMHTCATVGYLWWQTEMTRCTHVLQSVTCGDRLRWRDAHLCYSQLPVVIDWLDEMHACVTVCAGMLSGSPAPSAACKM